MSYKKYFFLLLFIDLLALAAKLFAVWLIDPIGMWGAPIVRGFNHYKVMQGAYLDVYKPYEYMREKPDILYIGESYMYVGFEPICKDHPEKKVYTMGLSMLTLSDMREYLRFVYKVHKPEIIFLGLNPYQFKGQAYRANRNDKGFSQKRLDRLSGNVWGYYWQAVTDSLQLHDVCWLTVKTSRTHKEYPPLLLHGWDVKRGNADAPNPKAYYSRMGGPIGRGGLGLKLPEEWHYTPEATPEALDCWWTIVTEANEAGVPLIAFFVPWSVDDYAIEELKGHRTILQSLKWEVAHIIPMYDFTVVSELATNRQEYFYDTGHFRASLGEKLKPCLESGNPTPYGYLLTPETADDVFAKENAAWEKWAAENWEYVNALKACIEIGHKPEVGEFEKYIGF